MTRLQLLNTQILLMTLLACFASQRVHAQASDNLVNSIMQLRADVEQLYGELEDGKQDHRATMRSLAAQKADLEAQINRQEISLRQLEIESQTIEREIARQNSENTSLKPVLKQGLDLLEDSIENGIPFKRNQRLDDLSRLRERIETEAEAPERSLAQLWASYEDLLRLTRENGIFKQEIQLGDEVVLADVAKIGTIMLFFRTPTDLFGHTTRLNGETVYSVVTDPIEAEQISRLFEAFEKQIRTGYFSLPAKFVFEQDLSEIARGDWQ